ncbi:hypothetical protein [Streptomyces sp. MST-110588]|uniref:hypothetical protein n=1 Tax=Streptomyces sp. MST-110588 TaxID=2833628 RepID=UPI001F5D66EA|nr:hypothetical protein [Streptomyces sp. MST-110588]UNO40895.1 hypothetical protein KGS77_16565 [Streptomyces sp. MST-110588]
MNYLRSFIPWIAYAVVSSAGWQWGALTGLVLGGGLLVADRAIGLSLKDRLLDYGTIAYFAALAALAFLSPDSPVKDYSGALSSGWLAVLAWGSIAARQPFTLAIARRMVPPEVWKVPLFYRINVVITAAWAASFTLSAMAQALITAYELPMTYSVIVHIIGFLLPIRFTSVYPERARTRFLQRAGDRHALQEV